MADGLAPEMQGSPNPLILRNYRMIPPNTWKFFNLSDTNNYPGEQIGDRDINLVFKVEAAPVVLPYESELILKFTFLANKDQEPFISNQWTPNPLYRIRAKSISHIVKRCWATISNMTFQSYRQPHYLNEILLRKPAHVQMKYPDTYTGEKIAYLSTYNTSATTNITGHLENPSSGNRYAMFLEPLSRTIPNDGQLYFMTPQFFGTKEGNTIETTLTFRIPFTELLPVFKIGVIPLIMIASNSFDLLVELYNPKEWFVDCGLGEVQALETYLNVSTVSFPDINPTAEMLIRPRIYDSRFIAPFLDYLVFEKSFTLSMVETQLYFNINQYLRNVPFISISFLDYSDFKSTSPNTFLTGGSAADNVMDDTNVSFAESGVAKPNWKMKVNQYNVTGEPRLIGMSALQAERGGFFSLPPNVTCKDLNIVLGESAFPLTQVPMSWDDMYMYNRKHFEMYGRDFNVYRVSPIGRAYSGDATFFFDLSHAPMTGFQIGPQSPLQIHGKIMNNDKDSGGSLKSHNIRVYVTAYYSNNFNTMLASGGVVPLQ